MANGTINKGTIVKSGGSSGGGGGSSAGASLYDIKVMSQLVAEKGWAFQCKSTRQDLSKADVPKLYEDIKDKYDNVPETFNFTKDYSNGKKLYDKTDGRVYWFTWDTLNYSTSLDLSNPQTITLSEVSYRDFVLLGTNINIVIDKSSVYQKTVFYVYDKSWNYIKSLTFDYRIFTLFKATENGFICVQYVNDEYGKFFQVIKINDDINADYVATEDLYNETNSFNPLSIAEKYYDNKIYITGRTKYNEANGSVFTLELNANDFTDYNFYKSNDAVLFDGGFTTAISSLIKKDNTFYIAYNSKICSTTDLTNWTLVYTLDGNNYVMADTDAYYLALDSGKIVMTTDFTNYETLTTFTTSSYIFYSFYATNEVIVLSMISSCYIYGQTQKTMSTDTYIINGNEVEIDYYTKDGFKICIKDSGTNDTNLATVYSYMGYYNYFVLDTIGETVSLPRNNNLYSMMYVGDDYQDTLDGITGNATRLLPQAEVISDSSASVSLAVKGNKDCQLSASALTALTLSSCEDSQLGTTIRFTSGATPTTITDSASIDWVDGATPIPSASKTCLIFIWNKIGFYKEW